MGAYKYLRPITKEELSEILALREQGLTNAEIGKRLGRSEATIQSKLWQYKHGRIKDDKRVMKPWTIKELHIVKDIIDGGGTIREAGDRLDRKYSTVYRKISTMGKDFYDESTYYKYGQEE